MNFVIKLLLSKYVKGLLDKLPLNQYKTVLGVILMVLASIAPMIPEPSIQSLFLALGDLLRGAGIAEPASAAYEFSVGVVIVGAFHKLLKYLDGKKV